MEELLERARAYLSDLEADRKAALAVSEQKAEEAKLIEARQEGFQAALELLSGETSAGNPASGEVRELSADRHGHGERAPDLQDTRRRRVRRPIRELILRELSFSGQAMTAAQIAKAIDYIPERTETALERLEKDGQVVRNEQGRWTIGIPAVIEPNGHTVGTSNGKFHATAES
jgi:DNA-binding transcriptional ArsR family regulator